MNAARRFRLALGAGLTPVLLLGFVSSVLADRLAFLGWAVLTAALYVWITSRVWGAARGRFAGPLAVLALGAAAYAALALRYGEDLSLGLAAALPPAPAATP